MNSQTWLEYIHVFIVNTSFQNNFVKTKPSCADRSYYILQTVMTMDKDQNALIMFKQTRSSQDSIFVDADWVPIQHTTLAIALNSYDSI